MPDKYPTTQQLLKLLDEHSFTIVEHTDSVLRFASPKASIALVYDIREHNNRLSIGRVGISEVEITANLLNALHNSDKWIFSSSKEQFAQNVTEFLGGIGSKYIAGDEAALSELEEYSLHQSEQYNQQERVSALIRQVEHAWELKNYNKVINLIENYNLPDLPATLNKLLYMAQKEIRRNG